MTTYVRFKIAIDKILLQSLLANLNCCGIQKFIVFFLKKEVVMKLSLRKQIGGRNYPTMST